MGSDLSIVNAARVSFHKESGWENEKDIWETGYDSGYTHQNPIIVPVLKEADIKLLNYLAKHNHWSPFAHTSLQFRIKAPIFVSRQLVKHQVGGVWNEVSRRYVDEEPEFWFPDVWRGKPVNAKQGSSGKVELSLPTYAQVTAESSLFAYNYLLEQGVAPEQARMVLPQNMMTEWIWTGSLMFFNRVVKLRTDAHAQEECQQVARLINEQIPEEFAHSWKALQE